MKERMYLTIEAEKLSAESAQGLLEIYPDGFNRTPALFSCNIAWNSDQAVQLREALARMGFSPWLQFADKSFREFLLVHARDYEPSDFENCAWLETASRGGADFTLACRRGDGRLEIESRFFKRRIFLESNFTPSLIVSRQVRQWLEEAGLAGMLFRPTAKEKGRGAAEEDNLWELTTEHVLPPMSPSCTWFDERGNPTEGGSPERGRILKEGWCQPPEFHYLASSMKALLPSDFFLTWERFWQSGARQERRLVVSKRFYDFCKAKQLEMEWIPVRIDPD